MAKILVGVKFSLKVDNLIMDPRTLEVKEDETPKQMGDMDKRALEEALRIKEKTNGEVTVISIGPPDAKKILMEAYAMGADEAYLLPVESIPDTHVVSRIIAEFYNKHGPYDLIILGASSTDSFTSTLGARVAGLLGIPILPFAKKIEIEGDEVTIESELGDGTYKFKSKMPAVVTVTLEINEPRIPTLKDILKAKRRQIFEISPNELGVDIGESLVKISEVKAYEEKRKNIIFDASDPSKIGEIIDKLIEHLREEGVL